MKKEKKMKSPLLAAFLNLIFPGVGYIYAGKRVGFGTGFFLAMLVYVALTWEYVYNFVDYLFGFIFALLFAYDGYKTAKEVNNSN